MEKQKHIWTSSHLCLLIPYYNDYSGLCQTLQSVIYDVEKLTVLIVDDGSTIPLAFNSIGAFLPFDYNVKIIRLPFNQGITKALNAGLTWIKDHTEFNYIARLDCGDVCSEDRFYKQVHFFEAHSEIDFLGTWCIFNDGSNGASYLYKTPVHHQHIKRAMHFRNVFIHPTVMWRASVEAWYPEHFPHAEDYGLFYTFVRKLKSAILKEPLVTCRISTSGLSVLHRRKQLSSRGKVVKHFGSNDLLILLGIIKLQLLALFPYHFILKVKRMLYPNKGLAGT